jgi:hypothetical protein
VHDFARKVEVVKALLSLHRLDHKRGRVPLGVRSLARGELFSGNLAAWTHGVGRSVDGHIPAAMPAIASTPSAATVAVAALAIALLLRLRLLLLWVLLLALRLPPLLRSVRRAFRRRLLAAARLLLSAALVAATAGFLPAARLLRLLLAAACEGGGDFLEKTESHDANQRFENWKRLRAPG